MNVFDENLLYTLADMLIEGFDFHPIKKTIHTIQKRYKSQFLTLKIEIEAIVPTPESELIQMSYIEGKIKSYERKAICVNIYKKIKGEVNINLEKSLNKYPRFSNCIKTNITTMARHFLISLEITNAQKFSTDEIYAMINQFNVESLGYCPKVKFCIWKLIRKSPKAELITKQYLQKKNLTELSRFITLKEKERVLNFYSHPDIFRYIIDNICVKELGYNKKTELTYDKMLPNIRAQKRRKVFINGKYENLHDVLTPYITLERFIKLIDSNNILAFYPSVRSLDGSMVTALIDIDFPSFLRKLVPDNILWEFNINIAQAIIKNFTRFGLPPPLTIFSGGFGVHCYYFLSEDCLDRVYSFLNYVNYKELYILPAQKSLIKNMKSALHSQFALMRLLLAGILLYTVSRFTVEDVPKEIREILGSRFINVMDLFSLSPFSDNKIGTILLDLSPNYPSVHRIFSWNLSTGHISIPITDPKTGNIAEKFRNYPTLLEEAAPETVLERIKSGEGTMYFQFPPKLHRSHIEKLLRPDTLLPYISTIVRFSEKWITERSRRSFAYWLDLYKLNNLYDYLMICLQPIDFSSQHIGNLYQGAVKMIESCNPLSKTHLLGAIDDYFFRHRKYSTLESSLKAFRDLEFYYSFKPNEIRTISEDSALQLINKNDDTTHYPRRMFFRKFLSFFNIVQVLIRIQISVNKAFSETRLKAIKTLWSQLSGFKSESCLDVSSKFIKIIKLYNIFVNFIDKFDIFHKKEAAAIEG